MPAPFKGNPHRESDPANDKIVWGVGMMSEEIAIVTIADQVAVEGPLPGGPIVQPFSIDGGVVEQVASTADIGHDGCAPPIVQR